MPVKKIKIGELPKSETLEGFKTVGVDKNNSSVSVDLSFVGEAAEAADTAAGTAANAAANAGIAAGAAVSAAEKADAAIGTVTAAAAEANAKAEYAQAQGDYAKAQGELLEAKAGAILQDAELYTDQREEIVRRDFAAADADTLLDAKAYADQLITTLVDGSPAALDTLNELSAALGDDPNFSATVMQLIGEKLDKTGGTVTGALTCTGQVSGKGSLFVGSKASASDTNPGFCLGADGTAHVFSNTVPSISLHGAKTASEYPAIRGLADGSLRVDADTYGVLDLYRHSANGCASVFRNSAGTLGKLGFAANGDFALGSKTAADGTGDLMAVSYSNKKVTFSGPVQGTTFTSDGTLGMYAGYVSEVNFTGLQAAYPDITFGYRSDTKIVSYRFRDGTMSANYADVYGKVFYGINLSTSDRRYKTNITAIDPQTAEKSLGLIPKSYTLTDSENQAYGYIAQEVQEVYPELVHEDESSDDKKLSLDYNSLLVLQIKGLMDENKELRKRIEVLESKNR